MNLRHVASGTHRKRWNMRVPTRTVSVALLVCLGAACVNGELNGSAVTSRDTADPLGGVESGDCILSEYAGAFVVEEPDSDTWTLYRGEPCDLQVEHVDFDGEVIDVASDSRRTYASVASLSGSTISELTNGDLTSLPGLEDAVGHTPTVDGSGGLLFTQNRADGGFSLLRWDPSTEATTELGSHDRPLAQPVPMLDGSVVVELSIISEDKYENRVIQYRNGDGQELFTLGRVSIVDGDGTGQFVTRPLDATESWTAIIDSTGSEVARVDGWLPLLWIRDKNLILVASKSAIGLLDPDVPGVVRKLASTSSIGTVVAASLTPG